MNWDCGRAIFLLQKSQCEVLSYFFLQEEIHELLLSFAEAGATVVRLKGGDPLVSFFLCNWNLVISTVV